MRHRSGKPTIAEQAIDLDALLDDLDAQMAAGEAEIGAQIATMRADLDLMREKLAYILEAVSDKPEAQGRPPEGYSPSRRHGLRARDRDYLALTLGLCSAFWAPGFCAFL